MWVNAHYRFLFRKKTQIMESTEATRSTILADAARIVSEAWSDYYNSNLAAEEAREALKLAKEEKADE
jgi:peroxiredoxin